MERKFKYLCLRPFEWFWNIVKVLDTKSSVVTRIALLQHFNTVLLLQYCSNTLWLDFPSGIILKLLLLHNWHWHSGRERLLCISRSFHSPYWCRNASTFNTYLKTIVSGLLLNALKWSLENSHFFYATVIQCVQASF